MPDQVTQSVDKPRSSPRRPRKLLIGLLLALGVGVVAWEAYALSPQVRVMVVHVLGWVGSPAMPLVVDMSQDESVDVRKAAVEVLLAAKQDAQPALERSLSHPDAQRRRFAAEMLGLLGPAAGPALAEVGSKDQDMEVRRTAIMALGKAGAEDPKSVQVLIAWLEDPRVEIRMMAGKSLAQGGSKCKAAVPALIKTLRDAEAEVRESGAAALRKMGLDAVSAIPALTILLEDAHATVQWEAKEALRTIYFQVAAASPQGAMAMVPYM